MTKTDRASFRLGVRQGLPYGAVGFLISLSFGVLATEAGFTPLQAIATAAFVFAGSAQFAALSVLAGGGGIAAALAAATLMNSRFLAMGIALAPSLPGGAAKRALQGQAVVDSSWALSNRGTAPSTGGSCSATPRRSTPRGCSARSSVRTPAT